MNEHKRRLMKSLHDGKEWSIAELERELGVGSRQASRIITALRDAGAPIEERFANRKKVFYIREEKQQHHAEMISFDSEEILALTVAAQAAYATLCPTPLYAPLQQAFQRLIARLAEQPVAFDVTEQTQHWHFGTAPSVPLDHAVFTALRKAIHAQHSVLIDYTTASTGKKSYNRKINPYSFAMRGTTWLLVAFCHRRNRPTDFAVADIRNVQVCQPEEGFTIPEDFNLDLHFRDRFGAVARGEPCEVRLLVEPEKAQYFRRKSYHPTQQIEKQREDGRIVVSYDVVGLDEVRSFVQGWGTGLTVVEPKELVEMIKQDIEVLCQRYGFSDKPIEK